MPVIPTLLRLFRRKTAPARATRTAARLTVEPLEGRCAPSASPAIEPAPLVGRTDMGPGGYAWEQWFRQAEYLASQGQRPVVLVGDSITQLYPAIGAVHWDAAVAPTGAAALGFGGASTSELLWLAQSGLLQRFAPKAIVLEAGTNNLLLRGQRADEAAAGVIAIAAALKQQLPDTELIVMGALPLGPSNASALRRAGEDFNRTLTAWFIGPLRDWGVTFVNPGRLTLRPDGTPSPSLTGDGVHPTALGYALYTGVVMPALTDALLGPKV